MSITAATPKIAISTSASTLTSDRMNVLNGFLRVNPQMARLLSSLYMHHLALAFMRPDAP